MVKALSRALPAFLFLLLAIALGCASTGSDLVFKVKKGTHAVVVGPKAKDITILELHLSRGAADVAFWVSRDKGKKLYIEFADQPFVNMQRQANGRYRVQCQGRHCYSDEINPEASYERRYKYWQILDKDGVLEEADGIIIIDP